MRAIAIGVLAAALMTLTTCGGQGVRQTGPALSGGELQFQADSPGAAPSDLELALAQVEALETPEGVDGALFAELKEALRVALVDNYRGTSALKGASCMQAEDLEQTESDGRQYLHWYYGLHGDFDLNGVANLGDITPLAVHFCERITDSTPRRIAFVDGDNNTEINAGDIVIIAKYFRQSVDRYTIFRRPVDAENSEWTEVGEVALSAMDAGPDGQLDFLYELEPDYADFEYYVLPRRGTIEPLANEIGAPDYLAPQVGALSGVVTDESGNPVAGATVTAHQRWSRTDFSATTDAQGMYLLQVANLSDGGTQGIEFVARCSKPGYAEGVETAYLKRAKCPVQDFTLLRRQPVASISALKGGSAVHKSTLSLDLPANSLVSHDGSPLTADVGVNLTYLEPTDRQMMDAAPGNFVAWQLDRSYARLKSFGMAEVFVDDGTGQAANLAQDKTATLTYPIPESMQADAPESTGLYSFDADSGIWIEESRAYKNEDGTAYVAEVSHFSYWNCDDPVDPTHIAVVVVDMDGTPLSEVAVTSAGVSYNSSTTQYTDYAGRRVFTVEQNATESISAEYDGYSWNEVLVQTPSENLSAEDAPVVATFTLPSRVVHRAIKCTNAGGVPVPYASVFVRWQDPARVECLQAAGNGTLMLHGIADRQLTLWAVDGEASSEAEEFTLSEGGLITLTIPGAKVPPVARFSIAPLDGMAPLSLTLDASASSGGDGIAEYHWIISGFTDGPLDVTESDPVLDGVVLDTPHHYYITLEVIDINGTSDKEYGSVCVY